MQHEYDFFKQTNKQKAMVYTDLLTESTGDCAILTTTTKTKTYVNENLIFGIST